ncbi:MAG TPA: ComEC family competence protein, partial [Phycisphaerae bacterium]|nr:ComEC family competence protein [Phycisphaerae bacterium]
MDELDPSGSQRGASPPVWRYEPLVPAAVAFMAGILAADYLGGGRILWSFVALAAAVVWLVFYRSGSRERWLILPLMLVLAAAGAARYRATVEESPNDIARLADVGQRLLTLEGIVVRSPEAAAPPRDVFLPSRPYYVRSTLVVACEKARLGSRWTDSHGRVRVTVRQPMPENEAAVPHLGDRIRIVGLLAPFGQPANPGTFDSARYFRRQGIRASFRTDHWEAVSIVQPGAERIRWFVGAIRESALKRLEDLPSAEGRAIVSAILFGRRGLLDDEALAGSIAEQDFIVSGAAHFLAVSGLHVGMVAGMVLLLTHLAGAGRRLTALLVGLVVLTYALMTELQPSVLRASVFIWILCLGWAVGRERLFYNSLAAAAILVLAVRPGDLFMGSFQLSFGILLGLMFLCRRIEVVVLRRDKEAEARSTPSVGAAWLWRRLVRPTMSFSISASTISAPLIAMRL